MKGGGRMLYAYARAVLFATFYRTPTLYNDNVLSSMSQLFQI